MSESPVGSRLETQRAVNWDALSKRLMTAQAAAERDFAPTAEEQAAILKARARLLAKEPAPWASGEAKYVEIVEFTLAHENYGIELEWVREICPLKALTSIPCTPPFVLGVVNIRGRILSLIDLKRFFGLPEKGLADLNRVIVLRSGLLEFGVLADVILGVRRAHLQDEQVSLPTLTGLRKEYLKGLTDDGTIVLEAAAILSDPGILVNDQDVG